MPAFISPYRHWYLGITDSCLICSKESILIGHNIQSYIADDLLRNVPSSTYLLVCDTNVYPILGQSFEKEFNNALARSKASSKRLLTYTIPPGEASKSVETWYQIQRWMLSKDRQPPLDTKSVIIALGGGVIGDLFGFVAATFKRHIRYVNVPTSLLAMVDSSIGGKVAIDTPVRNYEHVN